MSHRRAVRVRRLLLFVLTPALIAIAILASVSRRTAGARLYVTNFTANSVSVVSGSGTVSPFVAGAPAGTTAVAVDAAGQVYVAGRTGTTIQKYAANGASLGTFAATGLSRPYAMAFDASGNLFVANHASDTIRKYGPTGADLGDFVSTDINEPGDLAFDSAGTLHVLPLAAPIRKYDAAGTYLGSIPVPPGAVNSLAFDAANNLYVAADDGRIHRYAAGGTAFAPFAALPAGDFANFLKVDKYGAVYVLNKTDGDVHKWTSAGADLGVFAAGLAGASNLAFGPLR